MLGLFRSEAPEFLARGGEVGRLIADRDWSKTSIGPIDRWPLSLKTMLSFLLQSPVPMVMLWGDDGIMLYNQAYSILAGGRHPELLGSKVREGWPEVADFNDNVMRVGLAGGTLAYRDQELTLNRHGYAEQVWMNLDYSPVVDDDGRPAGVLAIVVETSEQVKAEARARESEIRFRNMADNAPVMMWVTDPSGYCTYLNHRWYEYTGQSPGDAEGYGWLETTHPDDKDLAERIFVDANAAQKPFRIEYRLRRADGAYRWAIDAAAPRFDANGGYLGYVGSVIDIDERREAEERLRLSEGRFRTAIDAVEGVLWTNDAAGRMTGDQPGWQRLTGQSAAEYDGYGWASVVHPDDARPTIDAWNAAVAERRIFEFEHRLKTAHGDYRRFGIRAIPLLDVAGEVLEWVGVHTDITDSREAEARLRRSETLAREERDRATGYLQVAGVMLLVLDGTGTIQTLNRKGAEILGYEDPQSLVGRNWFDAALPASVRAEVRKVFDRLMSGDGEAVANYENSVIRADGTRRTIAWSNTVLYDDDGRPSGTLSSGEDVTDQRESDARERLLVQEVDHRAKNLLAVVQSVVQLTRGDDIREFKEAVTGRIQSLARTHGLLAAARWDGADLRQLIDDELAPYGRDEVGRIRTNGPALQLTPPAAQTMALVIHELATNAAKYGALSAHDGQLDIEWAEAGDQIRLRWQESRGPPVSAPNVRGFGSIVLQTSIERQLRGRVELDWRTEGLVCELYLPVKEVLARGGGTAPPEAKPQRVASTDDLSGVGKTILVVEDEALIAAQIEDLLVASGYRVIGPVGRVADAFDQIYADPPDAALLDINVAGERSFALGEMLRSKGIPLALCTGYGEAAMVPETLREVPVILKPFSSDDLLRAVGRLLG